MDFDFSDEQYMLRDSVRDFLQKDCTPAEIRRIWEDPTGRSAERWKKLGGHRCWPKPAPRPKSRSG